MSYGVSAALQGAVYQALAADAALAALVGSQVFDAAPAGEVPDLYVALGPEDVTAEADSSGTVTTHRLVISVVGRVAGFGALKAAAAAVSDRLDGAGLGLARGHLLSMDFQKARARRSNANQERRIDMWFRAIVEDS